MSKERSLWMKGLLFAERTVQEQGMPQLINLVMTNEFADSDPQFANGVYDYADYYRKQDAAIFS